MPHKRNPAGCALALAAALRVPGLMSVIHSAAIAENERALGGWQAELATVPDLAAALGTSLDFLEQVGTSLVVDAARMRSNLETYGGGAPPARLATDVDELLAELAPYA